MKKGGYTWGLELLHDVPAQRINELHKQGWNIVLYQLSHPETVVRYYNQKKRAIPDIDVTLKKYLKETDGKLIWQNILEDESCGVGLAQEFLKTEPKTHAKAYKMTTDYFRKSIEATRKFPELDLWSVAGFANTAHLLAKQPEIKLLTIERANDDVDDLQTGISFFRGAAKQYGKKWGVDLSLWWGCVYGCIQEMPYLYHKRHLYLSWYSGAEHFRIEGSELFFDKNSNNPNKIVECLDQFGNYIKTHKRGKPIVPVAVILPEDHGWITPSYWRTTNIVWNYARIQYRQGQRAIDGFFSMAYPGSNFYNDPFSMGKYQSENPPASTFALSFISPEFTPDTSDVFRAEYPVNFGMFSNRREAQETIIREQIETSEFRPMGNSKWGDIIDVFTSEAGSATLEEYKVIVLLDQVKLDERLAAKLRNAMENGSTVIAAAGVITTEFSDLTGAEMTPILAVGSAWKFGINSYESEPFRYIPAKITTAKRIAEAQDGSPLIIENKIGKGRLVTSLVPWFEGSPAPLCDAMEKMFDEYITKVLPARIEGMPVEYLTTKDNEYFNVIVSNNSGSTWSGKICPGFDIKNLKDPVELITGNTMKYQNNSERSILAVIPPYEIRVFSWRIRK
jgi:hypothetical protein